MAELIAALVTIHGLLTFLADMYSFLDPPVPWKTAGELSDFQRPEARRHYRRSFHARSRTGGNVWIDQTLFSFWGLPLWSEDSLSCPNHPSRSLAVGFPNLSSIWSRQNIFFGFICFLILHCLSLLLLLQWVTYRILRFADRLGFRVPSRPRHHLSRLETRKHPHRPDGLSQGKWH